MPRNKLKYISILLILFLALSLTSLGCRELSKIPLSPRAPVETVSEETERPISTEGLRFIVFGDNRPANPTSPQPKMFKQLVEQMELDQPDLVFSVGDMVMGKTQDRALYRQQYLDFLEVIEELHVPFYAAAGNHDAHNSIGQSLFRELINQDLYYSLDYGGSHFIVLNTDIVGQAGKIAEPQLSWLKQDLETHKDASHIFVFMHRPPYSVMNPESKKNKHISFVDTENRNEIRSLMRNYSVNVVFAGHEHFFNKQVHDGVTYIITGCAGAFPYADVEHGGIFHYALVEVDKEIRITVVKLGGERIDPDSISMPKF